jgi:hypothetical protein
MNILQEMIPTETLAGTAQDLNLNPELRVPKREVPAEVAFASLPGSLRWYLFYLNFYSPRRCGEESLAEHLNSGQSFFPLRDKESNEFFIVHIDQILYVREAVPEERKSGRPLGLHLQDGTVLMVSLSEPRHAWRSRPLDLLNDAERFVSFGQDDHTRIHVNKSHIARVEGL